MNFWKLFGVAAFVIVAILGVLVYQYFWGTWSTLIEAERNGIAHLYIGTVSVVAIVFTLLYATVQFRKAIAKPQLQITVDQDRKSKASISTTNRANGGLGDEASINLYIYNDGNLVAELYSIEFKIPSIFEPVLKTAPTDHYGVETVMGIPEEQLSTITFYSRRADEYVSYVHKPVHIGSITVNVTPDNKDKVPKKFKISYRIFGSWAEKQEGFLDVSLSVE